MARSRKNWNPLFKERSHEIINNFNILAHFYDYLI